MLEPLSLVIASLSLGLTGLHIWHTTWRRGRIHAVDPPNLALVFDRSDQMPTSLKVYLPLTLFTNSARPTALRMLSVQLSDGITTVWLRKWLTGDTKNVRGSAGRVVTSEGWTEQHHFLEVNPMDFEFRSSSLTLTLFDEREDGRVTLFQAVLPVPDSVRSKLNAREAGLWWTIGPNGKTFEVEASPPPPSPEKAIERFFALHPIASA